jgi:hypothetical protein
MIQALAYAERGMHVLRLHGKEPDGRHAPRGVHSASCDLETIARAWRAAPAANIGIAISVGALHHVRVLDVDPKNGGDAELARLLAEHGPLPSTPAQRTGSGGLHVLLTGWPDALLRTKLAPGIELLGPGRYFVAAPSVHPSTRARYVWTIGLEAPIAHAPAWLVALASQRSQASSPRRAPPAITSTSRYARAALIRAMVAVEQAANGERNMTLNREAWSIGRFVQSGALDHDLVVAAFVDAAGAAGLGRNEAERTIASALRARRAS